MHLNQIASYILYSHYIRKLKKKGISIYLFFHKNEIRMKK